MQSAPQVKPPANPYFFAPEANRRLQALEQVGAAIDALLAAQGARAKHQATVQLAAAWREFLGEGQ